MNILRLLKKEDYVEFKTLINQFRESNFDERDFQTAYDIIFQNSEIWVIVDENNKLIGSGTMIIEQKFIYNLTRLAHIEDVIIDESHRKKGLGKEIIHHLINRAKIHKCYKVVLDCSNSNTGFYIKCGFENRGNQMSKLL